MERENVIKILKFYNDIDGHIAFARSALEDYEETYYGLHGGNPFGSATPKTNRISKPTEAAALNIPDSVSEKITELRAEIERFYKLQAEIFSAICKLPLREKTVVVEFYIKKRQWVQISRQIHYSETQCKKIRNKALGKLGDFFEQNELVKSFSYPI